MIMCKRKLVIHGVVIVSVFGLSSQLAAEETLRRAGVLMIADSSPIPSDSSAALHILQRDQKFIFQDAETNHVEAKVGQRVEFHNRDDRAHNIYSATPEMPFDLGAFQPDEVRSVTFPTPGDYDIECAIHPTMQLKITVK